MRYAIRLSLGKLLLITSVYAVYLAIVGGLPIPHVIFAAGIVVITLFVVADMRSTETDNRVIPLCARLCFVVSYYATAFAAAGAVSLALLVLLPEPATPPKPPLPFLEAVLTIVSGQLFVDIGNAIKIALLIGITFMSMFLLSGILAFLAALGALRYYRAAKWLAIVNIASVLLYFCWSLLQP
jgi:hypothetical protein